MNVIHLPPRLTVVPPVARPEPQTTVAHAEGRLRSAIGHVADASSHMLDAALCNGDREQNFDLASVAIEEALLDLLTLTAHGGDDTELRQILRARRAEREQG
ncbi:hypothetical protein [Rhizobium metallidurans]|uniref:Uncharacterized protein n=1 Tax=Rhizobium metallidurans TaxID=1265931 RepID=A0A7W6CRL5_9HYPH|nr:hypothetical protein [Rhizobium metallidurans]MBB3965927.1 hypothetical protein [Rhizobium metallidurans]